MLFKLAFNSLLLNQEFFFHHPTNDLKFHHNTFRYVEQKTQTKIKRRSAEGSYAQITKTRM